MIAIIGTSDQPCWLAEACKIPVWGMSGAVSVTVGTTISSSQIPNVQDLRLLVSIDVTSTSSLRIALLLVQVRNRPACIISVPVGNCLQSTLCMAELKVYSP